MDIVLVPARVHELICAKYLSSPNVLHSLTIGSTLNSANNKISVNQKLCIRFVDQCWLFCAIISFLTPRHIINKIVTLIGPLTSYNN